MLRFVLSQRALSSTSSSTSSTSSSNARSAARYLPFRISAEQASTRVQQEIRSRVLSPFSWEFPLGPAQRLFVPIYLLRAQFEMSFRIDLVMHTLNMDLAALQRQQDSSRIDRWTWTPRGRVSHSDEIDGTEQWKITLDTNVFRQRSNIRQEINRIYRNQVGIVDQPASEVVVSTPPRLPASYEFDRNQTLALARNLDFSCSLPASFESLSKQARVLHDDICPETARHYFDYQLKKFIVNVAQIHATEQYPGNFSRVTGFQHRGKREILKVYMPVYVFDYQRLGHTFHNIVNGFSGECQIRVRRSPVKTLVCVSSALATLQVPPGGVEDLASFLFSSMIPSSVAGITCSALAYFGTPMFSSQDELRQQEQRLFGKKPPVSGFVLTGDVFLPPSFSEFANAGSTSLPHQKEHQQQQEHQQEPKKQQDTQQQQTTTDTPRGGFGSQDPKFRTAGASANPNPEATNEENKPPKETAEEARQRLIREAAEWRKAKKERLRNNPSGSEGSSQTSSSQSHSHRTSRRSKSASSSSRPPPPPPSPKKPSPAQVDPLGYYAFLGVEFNASKEEIDLAYKRAARRYHPDLQPDEKAKQAATEKFVKLAKVADILRDGSRRKRYDAYGR